MAHEGEREFLDDKGAKFTKIYPRGDKRVIDPITDLCDIVGYAQIQPPTPEGDEVYSTLYLKGTPAYHARSRFVYMPKAIPEWNLQKLDKALADAITAEEKSSGMKAITSKEAVAKEQKIKKTEENLTKPLEVLINTIGDKLNAMQAKDGSIDAYFNLMQTELGTVDFKAMNATEAQRQQLELLIAGLTQLGY